MIEAGLGKRKVGIPDIDCSAQEFKDELIKVFPKLKYAEALSYFSVCQIQSFWSLYLLLFPFLLSY